VIRDYSAVSDSKFFITAEANHLKIDSDLHWQLDRVFLEDRKGFKIVVQQTIWPNLDK
jgi:hypothetical protein